MLVFVVCSCGLFVVGGCSLLLCVVCCCLSFFVVLYVVCWL